MHACTLTYMCACPHTYERYTNRVCTRLPAKLVYVHMYADGVCAVVAHAPAEKVVY